MSSRLLRTVIMSAYTALFIQLLKCLLLNQNIEIIEIKYVLERKSLAFIEHELLIHKKVVSLVNLTFKRLERHPTDYKYILKWTKAFSHYNSPLYLNGQRPFLNNKCTFNNCYLTNDKSLLNDVRFYDAILFDVENSWDFHPVRRSRYQKYIFLASESADNHQLCAEAYDNYYNLTWTYRLDSDIRWSYITVLYKNGSFAGPKIDMKWIETSLPTPDSIRRIITSKNKTAAWFVSNCHSKSNRQNVTDHLKSALMRYGLEIDVYGWCGPLRCPRDRLEDCLELLEQQYHFYLAFENSLDEDYVTEKVLYALRHHTVPIVYGGANYSRFLPPKSYIDAGALDARTVAAMIHEAISHPEVYENYFRWHNYYTYKQKPETTDLCNLCRILNEPMTFKSVENFRTWWNKDFENICRIKKFNSTVKQLSYKKKKRPAL